MANHIFKKIRIGDRSFTTQYFYIFDYLSMVHAIREILSKNLLEYTGVLDWHKISDVYRNEEDFPKVITDEVISVPKIVKNFMINCKKIFREKKTIIMNSNGGWQIFETRDPSWVEVEEIKKDNVLFN